jgi:hypothetical protein
MRAPPSQGWSRGRSGGSGCQAAAAAGRDPAAAGTGSHRAWPHLLHIRSPGSTHASAGSGTNSVTSPQSEQASQSEAVGVSSIVME